MVQAIVTLNENESRVINIIKGKFGLKNKSEAINLIISEYEQEFLEPELRPEYIKKLKKIRKGKYHKFKTTAELKKMIENDRV